MKRTYILLLLIISSLFLKAQNFTSVVKDSIGNPVVLAEVVVLSKVDSSLVEGTTTDSTGSFTLKTERTEDKFVVISFVGYKH